MNNVIAKASWMTVVDEYLQVYNEIHFFPEDFPLDTTNIIKVMPADQTSQRKQTCGCKNIIVCNG